MNKILMNNNKNIIIDNLNETLELKGQGIINIFNSDLHSLKLDVQNNAKIIINDFRIINETKTDIKIKIHENAILIYNQAFINENKYHLNINAEFLKQNSQIKINIHGVNDKGRANIRIDGIIGIKNYHNELMENIRIININNGKCESMPNMFINNSQVIANHHVTVGKINEEELYYLMSKNISEEMAKKLIINGFLTHIIEDKELVIKIKEILTRR